MSFFNPTKPAEQPTTVGLVPTYLPATQVTLEGAGASAANKIYWASESTAQELAGRLGAAVVIKPAFFEYTWIKVTFQPATQFYLQFPNGTFYNAGELAGYFTRNPEAQFPGLAEKLVRNVLVRGGYLV